MSLNFNEIVKKNILVVQARSFSGLTQSQKSNLIGLGLNGIGSKSNLICSESVLGMIKKVSHLIKINVSVN